MAGTEMPKLKDIKNPAFSIHEDLVKQREAARAEEQARLDALGDAARLKDRRERIATAVLAGMLASSKTYAINNVNINNTEDASRPFAAIAVHQANALIAELDK